MTDMTDFDSIYAELVARYGAATVLDKAACRQVAKVLASDTVTASDMVSANALLSQLPKPSEARPWDLSRLSDKQLALLEKLGAIATGEVPPAPEHRRRSTKHWAALQVAALLDKFFARVAAPGEDWKYQTPRALIASSDNPMPAPLTVAERGELISLIDGLLSPLRVPDIYCEVLANAYAVVPSPYVPPAAAAAENPPAAIMRKNCSDNRGHLYRRTPNRCRDGG